MGSLVKMLLSPQMRKSERSMAVDTNFAHRHHALEFAAAAAAAVMNTAATAAAVVV